MIKDLRVTALDVQTNTTIRFVGDPCDFRPQVQMVRRETIHDCVDIACGASGYRKPVWASGNCRQKMMVPSARGSAQLNTMAHGMVRYAQKSDQSDGREFERALLGAGTPHSRGHGNEVVVSEGI